MRSSERIFGIKSCITAGAAMFAVLVASPVLLAKEPDAAEILRRAEEVRNPGFDFFADVLVRTASPQGRPPERVVSFSMIASRKDRTMLLRRSPKILYAGTFLIADDKYWMLLPRSPGPKELVAGPQIVHGEIANADLMRMNFLRDWEPRLLGEEKFEDDLCYKLDLNRTREGGAYTRVLYWIRKKDFLPRRFEYYGGTPALRLKMSRYEDYRKGSLGLRPMRIIIEGGNPWEDVSTVTLSNLRRSKADAVSFTLEGMVALRDAARDKQKATQSEDATLEDLLAGPAPAKP